SVGSSPGSQDHGLRKVQVRAGKDGAAGKEEAARDPSQGSEVPSWNRRARLRYENAARTRVSGGRQQGEGDADVSRASDRASGARARGGESGCNGARRRREDRDRSEVRRKVHD